MSVTLKLKGLGLPFDLYGRHAMAKSTKPFYVYVLQSLMPRPKGKPGFYYVGCTTDVQRRLLEHNGLYPTGTPGCTKGSRYTSKFRVWELRAVFGEYDGRSSAQAAERTLKHSKRGVARTLWSVQDSHWCRGLGTGDPRIPICNEVLWGFLKQ